MKSCNQCKRTDVKFSSRGHGKFHTICQLCQREKSNQHYHANKSAYKKRSLEYRRSKRDEARRLIDEARSKPCHDCEQQHPRWRMELDHRDPSKKTRCVSEMVGSYTLQQIAREIEKCDAVCANCHRDRTFFRKSEQNAEEWRRFALEQPKRVA